MARLGGLAELRCELLERLGAGEAACEAQKLGLAVQKRECLGERECAPCGAELPVDLARELEVALVLDRQAQVREVLLGAQRADPETADRALDEGRDGAAIGGI